MITPTKPKKPDQQSPYSDESPAQVRKYRRTGPAPGSAIKLNITDTMELPLLYDTSNFRDINKKAWCEGVAIETNPKLRTTLVAFVNTLANKFHKIGYWVTVTEWNEGILNPSTKSRRDVSVFPLIKPTRSKLGSILPAPFDHGKQQVRSSGSGSGGRLSDYSKVITGRSTPHLPAKTIMTCTIDRNGIPSIIVTVIPKQKWNRRTDNSKEFKAARFEGHSKNVKDRKGVVLTARIYATLVQMQYNSFGNKANQLPGLFRRFTDEQWIDLAANAQPQKNNSAACLSNTVLRTAWRSVCVGAIPIYTYLNKRNAAITKLWFPFENKSKRLKPTLTAAAFGRKLDNASQEGATKTQNQPVDSLTFDPLRTGIGRAMSASMKERKKKAPQTKSNKRSTKLDQTLTPDDLELLLGGTGKGVGIVALLKKQVNQKKCIETMALCGIDEDDVGLHHHLAYMLAKNFLAVEIAVNLRASKSEEMKPADEMMKLLMHAQADPAAALRSMKHSALKVLLVTLLVTSFNAALSDETLSASMIERRAFNIDRKTDVKNFDKKARKVLAMVTIVLSSIDTQKSKKTNEGMYRAFTGLELALSPLGGVVDKTLELLKEAGICISPKELSDIFQEMSQVLTPFWMWERDYHNKSTFGLDNGSRAATIVAADNADCALGKGSGEMANMIAISATTVGDLRLSREDLHVLKHMATSRADVNDRDGSQMPRLGDEKLVPLTRCETAKYMLACQRRVLLAMFYAANASIDAASHIPTFKANDRVELTLNGSNYKVDGMVLLWNSNTGMYRARYGTAKVTRTDSFSPERVGPPNSNTNTIDVDSDGDLAMQSETKSESKNNFKTPDTETDTIVEAECPVSEIIVIHVMEGVSSKKKEATAQMVEAARAALVAGGSIDINGVIRGGMCDSDTTIFITADFEFMKALLETWLTKSSALEFPLISFGHGAKALATKAMTYFEEGVTRPLLSSIDKTYNSPAYNALKKGTRINQTIKEVICEGLVMLTGLVEVFLVTQGELKVDPLGVSPITVKDYLSNPSRLQDTASCTVGYVVQYDGRPELLPMDKYGHHAVQLFHEWLKEEAQLASVVPSDKKYMAHSFPTEETEATEATDGGDGGAGADGAGADGGNAAGGNAADDADASAVALDKLEQQIMFQHRYTYIKQQCKAIAATCEDFEWKATKTNQDVTRSKLLAYLSAIERGAACTAAAAAAKAVTRATSIRKIEGIPVPAHANLNLCWMSRHALEDTAALSYVHGQTRLVMDAEPHILVDQPDCDCGYPHGRCYCEYGALIAIKVMHLSVSGHNQYNYQYTLLYQLLALIGIFHNKNQQVPELVLQHLNGACAVSLHGHGERGIALDMLQENGAVKATKEMHRPSRPFKATADRTIAHTVKIQLARRRQLATNPAAALPVSLEKKALWQRENQNMAKELVTVRVLLKEVFENKNLNEVPCSPGSQLLKPKRMYNSQHTSRRQRHAATLAFVRALQQGVAPKLPANPVPPNKSISLEPPSKDKRAKEDKKERARAAKDKRQQQLNAQVETGQAAFVPDDIAQVADAPSSTNKAAMVLDLVKHLLDVVAQDVESDAAVPRINHLVTKDILQIYKSESLLAKQLRCLDANNGTGTVRDGRARKVGGGVVKLLGTCLQSFIFAVVVYIHIH